MQYFGHFGLIGDRRISRSNFGGQDSCGGVPLKEIGACSEDVKTVADHTSPQGCESSSGRETVDPPPKWPSNSSTW